MLSNRGEGRPATGPGPAQHRASSLRRIGTQTWVNLRLCAKVRSQIYSTCVAVGIRTLGIKAGTCVRASTYKYIQTCTCRHPHANTHTDMYMYVYTRTRTILHACVHTYKCAVRLWGL